MKLNQQGIVHLLLLIILLGGIITGVYLVTSGNPLKLFPKAFDKKETGSIDSLDKDKEKKPEFAQGEVLIKLKTPLGKLNFKPGIQSLDIENQAIPFSSVDTSSLPSVLGTINSKYQIKTMEKVFKGTQSPEQELAKFKTKFSQDISEGKRKIEEGEFLKHDLSRTHKLTFEKQDISIEEVVEELKKNPDIDYAEPNFIYYADVMPNDPDFPKLWGLHNTGQTGGKEDADIDAPEAWEISKGSEQVVVGVIDSGVDYNHPDLAANIWVNPGEIAGNGIDDDNNGYIDDVKGWDFNTCVEFNAYYGYCDRGKDEDNDPMDDRMHGTHVAGTIGAAGNNSIGVAGVSWHVKLMPLKFLNSQGKGYLSAVAGAIHYATLMGVKVTNNSWGGSGYSQTLYDVINEANATGSLFVAAAGNSFYDLDGLLKSYPASYIVSNIVSVAASTAYDHLTEFSNYGYKNVHIAAPGEDIYSTIPDNKYMSLRGTSMAAPHVTGAIALLVAKWPDKSVSEIKELLLVGVDKNPGLADVVSSGGRLNIYKALLSPLVPAPTMIPNPGQTTGKAFVFGGRRYISVVDQNQQLASGENLTIEVWVKPYMQLGFGKIITRQVPPGQRNYALFILYNKDVKKYELRFGFGINSLGEKSEPVIPPEAWSHVAVVKKANTLTGYINGQKVFEKTGDINKPEGDGYFQLGSDRDLVYFMPYKYLLKDVPFDYFRGELDDLRISNNARDIESSWKDDIYQKPLAVDANTVALWRFDGDLTDSSQNHLNGVAVGNTDYVDGRVIINQPATFVCNPCAADVKQDGRVDAGDYAIAITCWNKKSTDFVDTLSCDKADINKDSLVNQTDLDCLQSQYGKSCVSFPTPTPIPVPASIKVSFKDTSGKPISQIACAACWNDSGGYTKPEQCQTGTEVVIAKPAVCNTYNPVLGVTLPGGNRTEATNVSANPASSFKTYMNQYFGWSDIKTWTEGQRNLTITVKPAQMWTPPPRSTPTPRPTPAKRMIKQ